MGLFVVAMAVSNISPMSGIYDLRINQYLESSFVRHLAMGLVRYEVVPAENDVIYSEEAFRETADDMSFFSPGSWRWMSLRCLIPRQCTFIC